MTTKQEQDASYFVEIRRLAKAWGRWTGERVSRIWFEHSRRADGHASSMLALPLQAMGLEDAGWWFPKQGDPHINPQNTMILIVRTAQKGNPNSGKLPDKDFKHGQRLTMGNTR